MSKAAYPTMEGGRLSIFSWEKVYPAANLKINGNESTFRAKVDGGWLYRHVNAYKKGNDPAIVETMCFVPDPTKD